ncbi:ribonuclease Z [Flavicella sediminum]|uniref:ribonuclease Z n=1 Tax=Flavicella sediminum TaxID=2585141 RepID=UPI001AA05A2E|nr:ribonuclease Z [Flavicella sediminum]
MSIKLTILGCHSATPRIDAHPTSQYLEINERHFLIDCGEGTQTLLRKHKIQFAKIRHIFISHLHGDHFYGLIGLISTFGLLNREHDLHVYGPKGIKEIIVLQLKIAKSWTNFKLIFHELEGTESQLIFEDKKVEVHTIPLNHRIYTNGYLFKEKVGERKLNMDAIQQNSAIEICDYHNLKKGKDFTDENGTIIPNKRLTFDPTKNYSYAFCSDTAYKPDIVPIIKNVDLLYHEATFLEDRKDLTERTKHSTAKEAAAIAKEAAVKHLIIGHYSSRYKDLNKFKEEASTVFTPVSLAASGKIFELK